MSALRVAGGLLLVAAAGIVSAAEGQYFGHNKVQYRRLDFKVIRTEHFDIYYYDEEREAAVDAARMAERAYARLSRILNHRYRERQPIIVFASHSEFQQNNITSISEGTGGVTEAFRHRILLPFTGSYADFEHVLQHELVHQFQYDVFARGRVGGGIQRLVSVNPPLWFMEGMAEYLSLGPITPQTAMWLRDAALEGGLPSLAQLTWDPSYFPYRFGHALWSYVGERWGDEAIGEILNAATVAGVEAAFRRVLGLTLEDVIAEWHDAIQRSYLPQVADLRHARHFGRPVLTERRSKGSYHISPALSPDGRWIAYLSEGNSFFIDLYLADAETGEVKRRLTRSAFSSDFESLRFLSSSGSWSPDGRLFAIAVKRGGADDLVIFDMERHREHARIRLPLSGAATPAWSPDGRQLVFTGFRGGLSDLYIVNADGSGLRQLTDDKFADLNPAWSPDGRTIAFATDRGPGTDFERLEFAALRIALFHLGDARVELLGGMNGLNVNPQWAPDGSSIAFVSDRTGIPNLFLYELRERETYQLTDVWTGTSGITELSPVISWAPLADRLVFTYFTRRGFDVYAIDNPRSLKRAPYDPTASKPLVATLTTVEPVGRGAPVSRPSLDPADSSRVLAFSFYRSPAGLRSSAAAPLPPDSAPPTLTVRALLDSTALHLPDSSEFTYTEYTARLSPDYVVQPTIGYARDNFGNGLFGGSAIALSDMLGNHRVFVGGQINGRLDEAQVLGVYANLSRRLNWAAGVSQDPLFFFSGTSAGSDSTGNPEVRTRLERFVVRQFFGEASYPFSRFQRVEVGLRASNVDRSALDFVQTYDPVGGTYYLTREIRHLETTNFVQPSIATVFDNSVSWWTGPFLGRRSRFEYAPAIGDWQFHQFLGDYRRYDHLGGWFTFATRVLFFGRFGADDDRFPLFLGAPELLRGYTAGSLRRRECRTDVEGSVSGCSALDQLIGARIAVANAELRFPLLRNIVLGFAPVKLPPIEGAIFFDAGLAWTDDSDVVLRRGRDANRDQVRAPLYSWGLSIRGNLLGFVVLRADYAKPLSRPGVGAYWTLSLGPTF